MAGHREAAAMDGPDRATRGRTMPAGDSRRSRGQRGGRRGHRRGRHGPSPGGRGARWSGNARRRRPGGVGAEPFVRRRTRGVGVRRGAEPSDMAIVAATPAAHIATALCRAVVGGGAETARALSRPRGGGISTEGGAVAARRTRTRARTAVAAPATDLSPARRQIQRLLRRRYPVDLGAWMRTGGRRGRRQG